MVYLFVFVVVVFVVVRLTAADYLPNLFKSISVCVLIAVWHCGSLASTLLKTSINKNGKILEKFK